MSIVVVFEVVFPYYYYTDPPKEIDVIDMEEFGYNKCDVSKQKMTDPSITGKQQRNPRSYRASDFQKQNSRLFQVFFLIFR